MAITYRGAGAASTQATAGTLNPALFESPTAGDLLVVLATARDHVTGVAVSGWTEVFDVDAPLSENICRMAMFYKIAAGADSDPAVVYTGGSANDTAIAQCCAFRGTHQTTPFDQIGATWDSNPNATNLGPITGLTPSVNDAAVIVCGFRADDWTSVDLLTGDSLTWVEIGEPDTTSGGDAGMVWDYAIISGSPVTITSKTFTVTGGIAEAAMGKMVSIQPPAAAVTGIPNLVTARRL